MKATTRYSVYTQTLVLLAGVLLIGGCGSDDRSGDLDDDGFGVGNQGEVVGGPCRDGVDCDDESFCSGDSDFPDGMCTIECRDDLDCPNGTACVDRDSGVCALLCNFDEDCRRPYDCKETSRHGHSGDVTACRD